MNPEKMLVECPECKGRVSEKAKTCPHCGFCLKKSLCNRRVFWLFLMLLVVMVGTFLFARSVREKENAEFERMKDSWPVSVPITVIVGQNKTKPMTASEWRSMNAKRSPQSAKRFNDKQWLREERLEAMRKSAKKVNHIKVTEPK